MVAMADTEKEIGEQQPAQTPELSADRVGLTLTPPAQHIEKEQVNAYSAKDGGSSSDESELEWTEEEERAIRRKIDWHTVPLVTLLYMLCFLDRINIGNARIQGMADELHLNEGVRFNWALSVFYIVYLTVEVPSNILLKAIGPRYYLPLLVCGFGLVSLCTAFVKDFAGLIVARVFLGIFEGGAMPGMAFFLSCFYKRNELLFRIGIYVSAASFAGAFGGLLATGLSRIPEWGAAGARLYTWRNIFFFEGLLTVIIGGLSPIWMPTTPSDAYFLNERERRIAAERLHREHKADPAEKVTMKDLKQGIFCIHNYTCALGFFIINITVQGVSVFMPTILNDLGYTSTEAQLYSVPPYVMACLVAVAVAWASDKTRQRGIWLAAFSLLAIIGFALLRFETRSSVRYMAVFFVTVGAYPGGPGFLSWAMNSRRYCLSGCSFVVTNPLFLLATRLGRSLRTCRHQRLRGHPRHHWRHRCNVSLLLLVTCHIDKHWTKVS
jgi:sugar phosphate permease